MSPTGMPRQPGRPAHARWRNGSRRFKVCHEIALARALFVEKEPLGEHHEVSNYRLLVLVRDLRPIAAGSGNPDPLSARWHGPAYRYPQNGWAVLHIEGEPYDRGYQHGWLMAKEIENYIAALSEHRATKSPTEYWELYRDLVGGLYLSRFDREYLEEMKGIAEGAAAAGAKAGGRPIDLPTLPASIYGWS